MHITVYRVDPAKRVIAALKLNARKKSFANDFARMLKSRSTDGTMLVPNMEPGCHLAVYAQRAVERGTPGFRIRGTTETTAGIAVLAGQSKEGGISHSPVNLAWIEREIIWLNADQMDEELDKEIAADDARLFSGLDAEPA